MSLPIGHKQNFNTLRRAFLDGQAALMECQLAATGEAVAVICAANGLPDGGADFVPVAMMFQDNPYTTVTPPRPGGGFYTQGDQNDG